MCIRVFCAFQHASLEEREKMQRDMDERNGNVRKGKNVNMSWKAVHLLGAEEVRSLFGDIVEGLAFWCVVPLLEKC